MELRTMRLGFTAPQFGSDAGPDTLLEAARKAEQLGYDSLWAIERLLYTTNPELIDSPPSGGPRLHTHLEASAGQIVVALMGVPRKFVTSGSGPLRQVDIHPSGRIQQVNIPEDAWPPNIEGGR